MLSSEWTVPADGIETLRSGYIVSRILLFIHFWVSVYTSQQPVWPRHISGPFSLAAVGLFYEVLALPLWSIYSGIHISKGVLRVTFYCSWVHKNILLCKATVHYNPLLLLKLTRLTFYKDVTFQVTYLKPFTSLVAFRKCLWLSVMFIFLDSMESCQIALSNSGSALRHFTNGLTEKKEQEYFLHIPIGFSCFFSVVQGR